MNAQQRRRERRAGKRTALGKGSDPADTFVATGNTTLPLSSRTAAWDAAAAEKTLDPGQYADAHFWRDPDGDPDLLASYKLPFARVVDGTLTAVWAGVTACAGALQGSRGGVDLPADDVSGVQSKIEAYYAKARDDYDDDTIDVPWRTAAATVETLTPERDALAAVEAFAARMPCADCSHAYTAHLGTDGPCTIDECDCNGYMGPDDDNDKASVQVRLLFTHADGVPLPDGIRTFDDVAAYLGETSATLTVVAEPIEAAEVSDGLDLQLPAEHAPGDTLPRRRPTPRAPAAPAAAGTIKTWQAVLCPEGRATDDGRIFAPESITWRDLPITLMGMLETQEGHDGAQVSGRIDRIWRQGGLIMGSGVFDSGEFGSEVARMVGDGTLRGVSVDIAVSEMDVLPSSEVLDGDGQWRDGVTKDTVETASPLDLLFGPPEGEDDKVLFVVWEAVIGAATVCPFPAFADATISLAASLVAGAVHAPHVWTLTHQAGFRVSETPDAALTASASTDDDEAPETAAQSLTAAAAGLVPVAPPAEWFTNPDLDELTPLIVTDDGRVYGHAAAWDVCHIGLPGVCVTAPTTETEYAYFHLGELLCDDGTCVAVGHITLDTGHASQHASRAAATAHYDHTGVVVADVIAGEDEHGIWVAGALRPDAEADKVRALRGASLSGDWRDVNGNLELVALLAVNVPGFPVPRTPRSNIVASGEQFRTLSLMAAGVIVEGHIATHVDTDAFSEIRELAARATEPSPREVIAGLARRAAEVGA